MAKPESLTSKFPILDSHHRIERFGIMFVVFLIALGSLYGISYKMHLNRQKVNLGVQAMYTTRSQWSLTGQYVNVLNIFRNDNSSKIFILLKTGEGPQNMSTLSTDANDYQIFMTGYNGDEITKVPKAAVYVFGNTGYMGLYFADSSGFDAHLYDMVLRCNAQLTSDVDSSAQEAYAGNIDKSYQYHNQIHLYANFAGSDAVVADFLNKDNPTTDEIYADVVASIDEMGVREGLDILLKDINDDMNRVNEYEKRLKSLGVVVPNLPAALAGDRITMNAEDTVNNPVAFEKSMVNASSSIIDSSYYSSEVSSGEGVEGIQIERTSEENTNKLYLVTDYVFPGGYQFNYQTVKLVDGTLDGLKPADLTFVQWVEQKNVEKQTYRTIGQSLDMSYYDTWYMASGEEFTYDGNVSLTVDSSIQTAISDYTAAVSQLYTDKYVYQTQKLYDLLRLEASSKTSSSLFSINASDSVLTMY